MIGENLRHLAAAGLCALTLAGLPGTASAWTATGDCSSQLFVGRYSLYPDPVSLPFWTAFRTTAYQYGSSATVSSMWRVFQPSATVDVLEYLPIPQGSGWWVEGLEAYGWDGYQWIQMANVWLPVNSGLYGYWCQF